MRSDLKVLVETLVVAAASQFSSPDEFENATLIGRLAALRTIKGRAITAGTFEKNRERLWESVTGALKDEALNPGAKTARGARWVRLPAKTGAEALDALVRQLYGEPLAVMAHQFGRRELLDKFRDDCFKEPNAREHRLLVIWYLVHLLGLDADEIPKKLSYRKFVSHELAGFHSGTKGYQFGWLWAFFNNSPFQAVNFAYPGQFLPYHMAQSPDRYWAGRAGKPRAIAALKEALDATGYPAAYYPKIATSAFFIDAKLTAPLNKLFGSHFNFLNAAYPGRYQPWEMAVTPKHYFDKKSHVMAATRWLVEVKLGYAPNQMSAHEVWGAQLAGKITKETFSAYGLGEIMATYHSPEPVMRMTYPGKFRPWAFQSKGKWSGPGGRQMAREATRWLFDEYLRIRPYSELITCETFRRNGLWGMLTSKSLGFNSSPVAALVHAYPEFSHQIQQAAAPRKRSRRSKIHSSQQKTRLAA